jgi:hypothetical protein
MATMRYLTIAVLLAACAGQAPPDTGPSLTCASYCSQLATTCSGDNAQFASDAACMATCAKYPPGALADTTGNSLGCRIYHIGNATKTGMPEVHCNHAGLAGGKIAPVPVGGTPDTHCADPCTNFCAASVAICGTGANTATQFTDNAACMTACAAWDRTAAFNVVTPVEGNNLACRMYHLTQAATDAATHCAHTGPTPTLHCK